MNPAHPPVRIAKLMPSNTSTPPAIFPRSLPAEFLEMDILLFPVLLSPKEARPLRTAGHYADTLSLEIYREA